MSDQPPDGPAAPTPTVAEGTAALAPVPEYLELLSTGEIEVEGRMPWSSNGTFLVSVSRGEDTLGA
ncbi:MAG: hypothetical protein ACYCSJ_12610, partial [Acidimicrobiales bacterium]